MDFLKLPSDSPLGVIAGRGKMPLLVIQGCDPRPVFVLAYHGITDPQWVAARLDHEWFYLGEVARALAVLRERGIQDLVMVGHFPRPSLRHLSKMDHLGLSLLAKLGLRWPGDNHVLHLLQNFCEEEGFLLRSPQEILPTLLASHGALGAHSPSREAFRDIALGEKVLDHLSSLDMGQGVAIQDGLILGVEAAEGTDLCIARCGALALWGPAVYVKRAKIGQSEKLDLPALGPKTLYALVEAKFQGIAFQAEKTLILFPQKVQEYADAHNLFLWGGS